MSKSQIHFFIDDIDFKLSQKQKHKNWLIKLAKDEGFSIVELNYIFTNDEYVLKINQDFLEHDTYTDIITFDNSAEKGEIEGEIYISIDRVNENAQTQQSDFEMELKRVMAHGLLHLCGYKDKSESEVETMRKKEDEAIRNFVIA